MSLDDFYLTSSGLATTETTLFIYDKALLHNLRTDVVMEPIRVMVANRLATNGDQWTDIVARENSGTYNNQWMVLDYKVFNQDTKKLKDGVFTVLEQLPKKVNCCFFDQKTPGNLQIQLKKQELQCFKVNTKCDRNFG